MIHKNGYKSMKICEKCILEGLEEDLKEYEKILLVLDAEERVDKLLDMLLNSRSIKAKKQKILVLYSGKQKIGMDTPVVQRMISREEAEALYGLYSMYEFSDRFQIISRTETYGDVFQLVDTGLITLEEAIEALLH